MGIVCSHRLVLGRKAHIEVWHGFSENVGASKFSWSDAENNALGPVKGGGMADLLLLRTLLAIS